MLNIGESITVTIHANKVWNYTNIHLIQGQRYQLSVDLNDQWIDGTVTCNADGFDKWWLKPFEWSKRVSGEKWFKLIGSLNADMGERFIIGTEKILISKSSGFLTCFANDAPTMYWNNQGSIKLKVTRIH
jgi:hypothetical protein